METRLADPVERLGYYEELRADIAALLGELPDEDGANELSVMLDKAYAGKCGGSGH